MSAIRKSQPLVKVKPLFYKKESSNEEPDLEAQLGNLKKYKKKETNSNNTRKFKKSSNTNTAYVPEVVSFSFGPSLGNIYYTKQPSYDTVLNRNQKIMSNTSDYGQYVDIGEGIKKRKTIKKRKLNKRKKRKTKTKKK